jgi:hypothetical protein
MTVLVRGQDISRQIVQNRGSVRYSKARTGIPARPGFVPFDRVLDRIRPRGDPATILGSGADDIDSALTTATPIFRHRLPDAAAGSDRSNPGRL